SSRPRAGASAWLRLTPTKTGPPRSKSQPELQTNFENFVTRSSQNAPLVVRKDRVHEQRHHHHGFGLRRPPARRLRQGKIAGAGNPILAGLRVLLTEKRPRASRGRADRALRRRDHCNELRRT